MEQANQARVDSGLSGSLLAGLVPPLLGLLAYAILREGYVWFYGRYGVVPEDVGVSQVGMLTGLLRIFHLWGLDLPAGPASNVLIVLLAVGGFVAVGRWLPARSPQWCPEILDSTIVRHPLLFTLSVLLVLTILASAWALPRDRDFAGRRLQLGQGVRPSQLAVLAIQTDPVQVVWTGGDDAPGGLVGARLVYLGRADGTMVLYDPPDWSACEVDACRGVVWRVNESDVAMRVEVNPPDRHAPKTGR